MDECNHNCASCSEKCESKSFIEPGNKDSRIKKIVGVISGKGGVGKSLTTSLLGVCANRNGLKTAILDADITGPSIPAAFGIHEKATGTNEILFPAKTKNGIEVMSLNLLLENETDPVVWRGPIVAGIIKQFWNEVYWGDLDVMFIDMPPGTGDVPLTVFQSIPLDGVVVVSTPQQLVEMIVEKAVNMAGLMNIPVLALVENMSYIKCPDCGKLMYPYGCSSADYLTNKFNIPKKIQIPIDLSVSEYCDKGIIEDFNAEWLEDLNKLLQ